LVSVVGLFVAWAAAAGTALDKDAIRKTKPGDLAPSFERVVLPNGLTVLLSPDPSSGVAVVDVSFLAGALFEPAGKSGMAHLVEHVVFGGHAVESDYGAMLEARGATDLNAFTGFDLMTFHAVVPPREVPFALWATSDRLLSRPAAIDDTELERNRRIVIEERAMRVEDAPYATAQSELFRVMFPQPHPLHGMVVGTLAELASVTPADVKAFIARCLVPANAVVTVTGNFDPAAAKDWASRTLGRLPSGTRLEVPHLPAHAAPRTVTVPEPRARRPRVTFAWEFGELPDDISAVLDFGSTLVRIYTDGALGMRVDAALQPFLGGNTFVFDVILAHEAGKRDARDSAEALLRYLTRATSDDLIFGAALLQRDRGVMMSLDDPLSRAWQLTRFEYLAGDAAGIARYNERHWKLLPWDVPVVARKVLEQGRFTLQSRPLNPLPERKARE
jgi:predicted Zn-dependent peptidase